MTSCDNQRVEWLWRQERDRGERLAAAIDQALHTLPLHHERVLRTHFGLTPNPRLEDVLPGALEEALHAMSRADRKEILIDFL